MPHNNLTIDFNDASFDESSSDFQPVPNVSDIDVVFPISDNENFSVARADNRTGSETSTGVGTGTASAIALMPDAAAESVMDEFLFEFENDVDPQDAANNDQGLKITTSGFQSTTEIIRDINITGSFEDLHNGGTLDVHIDRGIHNGQQIFQKMTLGAPNNNPGNDNVILVSGDNGADLGAGNDVAQINVDATADMTGTYKGGDGTDVLKLVDGVVSDNGVLVDFVSGAPGNSNSALINQYGGVGSGLNFFVDGWEVIELTNKADTIVIDDDTGAGLTTRFDATYLNSGQSNSMIEVSTGFTTGLANGGAKDILYVDADSNLYLNFDFIHQNIEMDASNKGIGVELIY